VDNYTLTEKEYNDIMDAGNGVLERLNNLGEYYSTFLLDFTDTNCLAEALWGLENAWELDGVVPFSSAQRVIDGLKNAIDNKRSSFDHVIEELQKEEEIAFSNMQEDFYSAIGDIIENNNSFNEVKERTKKANLVLESGVFDDILAKLKEYDLTIVPRVNEPEKEEIEETEGEETKEIEKENNESDSNESESEVTGEENFDIIEEDKAETGEIEVEQKVDLGDFGVKLDELGGAMDSLKDTLTSSGIFDKIKEEIGDKVEVEIEEGE
jgi:hypothetical protein